MLLIVAKLYQWLTCQTVITVFKFFSCLFLFLSHIGVGAPSRQPATDAVGEKLRESSSIRGSSTSLPCTTLLPLLPQTTLIHCILIEPSAFLSGRKEIFQILHVLFLLCLKQHYNTALPVKGRWPGNGRLTDLFESQSSAIFFSCFLSVKKQALIQDLLRMFTLVLVLL